MSETAELALGGLNDTSVCAEFSGEEWLQFLCRRTIVTHAVAHAVSHFVAKSVILDDIDEAIGDVFARVALLKGWKCNKRGTDVEIRKINPVGDNTEI